MEQMETETIILDTDILILIDYFRGVEEAKDYTKLRDREVRP